MDFPDTGIRLGAQHPDIADAQVAALVDDINTKGYGYLPGFIGPADLERMRAFVASAVQKSNGEYAGFTGPDAVAGSGLDELARSESFRSLIERIYERGTGVKPPRQDYYQILRCLTGPSANKHSYVFHYDSYVITALFPIEIPTSGQSGDFLMIPNTRRIRKNYLSNVIDKIILDNAVSQFVLRKLTKMRMIKLTRIKMVPGNAYFFWGYRTVHTNEPCDIDKVRATALFHYANPHAGSSLALAPKQKFRALLSMRS
jgi:hypothetical protein